MKPAIVASAIVLVASLPASAAPVSWQGEFMITTTNGGCPIGLPGDFATARFRPGIGGENGSDSYLTLFGDREARGYKLTGGLFGTAFQAVESMYVGSLFAPGTGLPVEIRFSSQKPDPVNPLTIGIDVRGRIRNYEAQPGCIVDFKLNLMRQESK